MKNCDKMENQKIKILAFGKTMLQMGIQDNFKWHIFLGKIINARQNSGKPPPLLDFVLVAGVCLHI